MCLKGFHVAYATFELYLVQDHRSRCEHSIIEEESDPFSHFNARFLLLVIQ